MTTPALAGRSDDGRRFYSWKGESFWSVTEIIGGGIPKYLHAHYAKMAAELAYERDPRARAAQPRDRDRPPAREGRPCRRRRAPEPRRAHVDQAPQADRADLALRWLKGAAERHRDAAGAIGTEVHDEAQDLVLRQARRRRAPPGPASSSPGPRTWPATSGLPRLAAATSSRVRRHRGDGVQPAQAYAGTLDAIVRIRAGLLVARSSGTASACPTWLAALDADALVTPDRRLQDRPGPRRRRRPAERLRPRRVRRRRRQGHRAPDAVRHAGAVLQLTAKGYTFRLARIDDVPFNVFLYAREVYRYRHEHAATVLLEDLSPVADEAVA
jgi:hypothetical protein